MAWYTNSGRRLMLSAEIVDFAFDTSERVVFEIVFTTETAGDGGISLHQNVFVTYVNIAALDVDVRTEGDATAFICCDLDDTLTVSAIDDAVDRRHGNGGTAVWAFAGNGCRHSGTLFFSEDGHPPFSAVRVASTAPVRLVRSLTAARWFDSPGELNNRAALKVMPFQMAHVAE
jgi:hypothetical protein